MYEEEDNQIAKSGVRGGRQLYGSLLEDEEPGDSAMLTNYGLSIADSIHRNPHLATQLTLTNHHTDLGSATPWEAMFLMTNCMVGTGMLNYPYGFKCAGGIFYALLLQIVFISLIYVSLLMLGKCTRATFSVTYQDTVKECCGHRWAVVARVCIILINLTACILMLVILGDNLDIVKKRLFDDQLAENWYLDRRFLVPVISILLVLPLCTLKDFHLFRYSSYIGVAATSYIAFVLTFVRYCTGTEPPINNSPNNVTSNSLEFLRFLPVIFFAFEAHIETPPMMAILKDQSMANYTKTLTGYVIMSLTIYNIVGIFGYLTFNDAVQPDFLLSYSPNDPLVMIAIALLSIKVVATFPVIFFCVRIVLEDVVKQVYPQTTEYFRRLIFGISGFTLCVIVSVVVPTISDALDLIGGLLALLVFFFPGLCYVKIRLTNISADIDVVESFIDSSARNFSVKLKLFVGCCFMLLGLLGGGFVTIVRIIEITGQSYSVPTNMTKL